MKGNHNRGVAQLASASGLGPEGPVFESQYPDHEEGDPKYFGSPLLFLRKSGFCIPRPASVRFGELAQLVERLHGMQEVTGSNPVFSTMISAKGIEKSFGDLKVLKGLDFCASKSEVVSIMGSSGAGKSTLLQILGTLSSPDSGTLVIDGTDVLSLKGNSLASFRNRNIGFVFQFHHLLPEFTSLENVMIPAMIAGRSRRDSESEAKVLLEDLGLSGRLAHKPSQLSGGEQQRVAIARALINRPAVLFADEPSGNLDSRNKDEIHNLFFSLRERYGQTIVIVTHDPELASMCDRSLIMRDGMFVQEM